MGEQRARRVQRADSDVTHWELQPITLRPGVGWSRDTCTTQFLHPPPPKKGKNKTHCVDLFTPLAAFLHLRLFFWADLCAFPESTTRKGKNNHERNTSHGAIRLATSAAGGGYGVKKTMQWDQRHLLCRSSGCAKPKTSSLTHQFARAGGAATASLSSAKRPFARAASNQTD